MIMLSFLLVSASAPVTPPKPDPIAPQAIERFNACADLAAKDPDKGVAEAERWRLEGGGYPARHCLGLAYVQQERWLAAAVAFEGAARDAEIRHDPRAAMLWVQAGNARLAGGEARVARADLDAALAVGILAGQEAGEAHLDRARALVASGDANGARADLDAALKLAPSDPLTWLLSATLARKQKDLARAKTDIAEAMRLAPDDASVALEAGNIAIVDGQTEMARTAWQGAIAAQPDSDAAKAAQAALLALDADKTAAKAEPKDSQ